MNLAVRHEDEVVYVERTAPAPAAAMMRVVRAVGARAPLHTAAVGKVFLAADAPEQVVQYARRTNLPRHTDRSLTDPAKLAQELDRVREQGYALDDEESEKGVCCVGAGIRNDEAHLVAALSISAPAERFDKAWSVPLREAAKRIARAIGYRG